MPGTSVNPKYCQVRDVVTVFLRGGLKVFCIIYAFCPLLCIMS
jgi:hypothetical protein